MFQGKGKDKAKGKDKGKDDKGKDKGKDDKDKDKDKDKGKNPRTESSSDDNPFDPDGEEGALTASGQLTAKSRRLLVNFARTGPGNPSREPGPPPMLVSDADYVETEVVD